MPFWTQGHLFEQTGQRTIRHTMLHMKVKAFELSDSEEKDF